MKTLRNVALATMFLAVYGAVSATGTPPPPPPPAPPPVAAPPINVGVKNDNLNLNSNANRNLNANRNTNIAKGGEGGKGGAATSDSTSQAKAKAKSKSTSSVQGSGNSRVKVVVNTAPAEGGSANPQNGGGTPNQQSVPGGRSVVEYTGTQRLKNTPDVSIGGPASGPCNGFSGGLGVSGPGFSVGGNTSQVDDGCTRRELIRVSAMIGRTDIAQMLLEQDPMVQEALKVREAAEYKKLGKVPPVEQPEVTDPFIRARMGLAPLPAQQ